MIDELEKEIRKKPSIKRFLKKYQSGKSDQSDVSLYAADLGECISNIINRNIKKDMTWSELNDMAMPLFKEVHRKVNEAAANVQEAEDKKTDTGIKPVIPSFPESKIHDLIYKIYEYLQEENDGKD